MPEDPARRAQELASRPWAMARIASWLNDDNERPLLLVRGDPGSGKSSLLLQQAVVTDDSRLISHTSRSIEHSDPFDPFGLTTKIVSRLRELGIEAYEDAVMPPQVNIRSDITINQMDPDATAVAAKVQIGEGTLTPLAESMIRKVPARRRLLLIVDALDQAEDEGAEQFLSSLARVARAAQGTGLRILSSSRRDLPATFDEQLAESFDLIADAPPDTSDLRHHLEAHFAQLEPPDRDRAVEAILSGANDNWLWATTNAKALAAQAAESGGLPPAIQLTSGLDGLYQDGIQRIKRKMKDEWEPWGRILLTVISCSVDERLSMTELRWIIKREPTEIEYLTKLCEPFLQHGEHGVRLFHPDFGRWILADNVQGITEQSGHLAVARGFTALGAARKWGDVARNAANRVIDHWCDLLVLDPFSPSFAEYEQELEAVLADRDWVEQATLGIDAIEQAAQVAPSLRFPATTIPLLTGLRAVQHSPVGRRLVEREVLRSLSGAQIAEFESIVESGDDAAGIRWLDREMGGSDTMIMRALWGGALNERVRIGGDDGQTPQPILSPQVVIESMAELRGIHYLHTTGMLEEIDREHLLEVIKGIEAQIEVEPDAGRRAHQWSLLGKAFDELSKRNGHDSGEAEIRNAVDAHRHALTLVPDGEDRQQFVIRMVDILRRLEERSDEDLDELIEFQRELVDLRRKSGGDANFSSKLLGDAYRERAERRKDQPAGESDRQLALSAYREALVGTDAVDSRLEYLIDLANMLLAQEEPSEEELEELISTQRALLDLRKELGDPLWPEAADLLGDTYVLAADRKRQRTREAEPPDGQNDVPTRPVETGLAFSAYREALAATPVGNQRRMSVVGKFANSLLALTDLTDTELDELVTIQSELVELLLAADEDIWCVSARIQGDVLVNRALREEVATLRDADLQRALAIYRKALEATADDELRRDLASDVVHALRLLTRRDDQELEELIRLCRERVDSHDSQDVNWARSSGLLGDAYRERGERREGEDREGDLALALQCYRGALASAPPGDERRTEHVIDLVNTLRRLETRSDEELDELIEGQLEVVRIRKVEELGDWMSSSNLLGDAYRERAEIHDDPTSDRAKEDLQLALGAYRAAVRESPSSHQSRIIFLLDLADCLAALPERTDEALDELIETQEEILELYRESGNPEWPRIANLTGNSYKERAGRHSDEEGRTGEADSDSQRALLLHRQAFGGTPPESEDYLTCAVDFADALFALSERTSIQVKELVSVQSEIVRLRRAEDHALWPRSANLLGDALRERASRQRDDGTADEYLRQALAAYREALDACPPDSDDRLVFVVDVANTLRDRRSRRSADEVDELVKTQRELLTLRKAAGEEKWPYSANLLGDAYRERAMQRDTDADREKDLDLALEAYREALDAVAENSEIRLTFAIDTANTMVIRAAVTKQGSPETLAEATAIVAGAAEDSPSRPEFARLLSVLRTAFRKHERWQA